MSKQTPVTIRLRVIAVSVGCLGALALSPGCSSKRLVERGFVRLDRDGIEIASDGVTLTIRFFGSNPTLNENNPCFIRYEPEITDTAQEVSVAVRRFVHAGNADCSLAGYERTLRVTLSAPVGDRQLTSRDRRS